MQLKEPYIEYELVSTDWIFSYELPDTNDVCRVCMLIMSYLCEGIGIIKLTVGIRKKSFDGNNTITMTQYGISALEEGQSIVVPRKSDKKRTKKKASR